MQRYRLSVRRSKTKITNNTKYITVLGTKAFEHSSFLLLGVSLLNACLRVSQQRNEVRMKQKPTCYAGGVKWLYRKIIYNQLKEDIRDILKQLCAYKGVEFYGIFKGKVSAYDF